MESAFIKQAFVAVSPLLASISVGGVIGYPNVLLQQLRANGTTIELDFETSSWIGSIHGLSGLPALLLPAFMQWRGRKQAFLITCLCLIVGWLLAYMATTVTYIIISECFHGLGINSILMVSTCSVGEMCDPRYRNSFVVVYITLLTVGIACVGILGQYLHWKTVSLIFLVPTTISFINVWFMWPESPSWLALKRRYNECERNFRWLRGNGKEADIELMEILNARKEKVIKLSFFQRVFRRDFIVPALLMLVLLNMFYFSGVSVVVIYFIDIVKKSTGSEVAASNGMIAMDIVLIVFTIICVFLVKRFKNKSVLIFSTLATILSMFFCCVVTYAQSLGYLKNSFLCLYGLILFTASFSLGLDTIVYNVGMEIMPVKHRGIGGALYVIYTCTLNSGSLKSAPYMFLNLGLWGTFLIYTINASVCLFIVWKFVPETKNRTLQEVEYYFNHGKFMERMDDEEIRKSIIMVETN